MDNKEIIETCERIITYVIQNFLANGTSSDEECDLVFETIDSLDNLISAVRET
jgi:hypothetical protein